MVPEIAIVGHPNEGKSSVLSTLAEDDSVVVSPVPGETVRCRTFPVVIDHREVLRFTDTPGFQNPVRLLAEISSYHGSSVEKFARLLAVTASSPEFRDDHELLSPIARGAGIIYVVDGSRPVRTVDRSEMEILRLIGKPRMAVLNCKRTEERYLEDWKDEFRKHFNASRQFNAHRATYRERIELLEALKAIDQDWQELLNRIIDAFKQDWNARARASSAAICALLRDSLTLELSCPLDASRSQAEQERELLVSYSSRIKEREASAHQHIRALFKHNIFKYQLPEHSILRAELFSERSWRMLGLTPKQVAVTGALGGAAVGAGIDVAALGHGLGLFTALGSLTGAVGALAGGRRLAAETAGLSATLAGSRLRLGPARDISMMLVLINRALLFYRHTSNWAHGRRDYPVPADRDGSPETNGFTRNWSTAEMKICRRFFTSLNRRDPARSAEAEQDLQQLLWETMMSISDDR